MQTNPSNSTKVLIHNFVTVVCSHVTRTNSIQSKQRWRILASSTDLSLVSAKHVRTSVNCLKQLTQDEREAIRRSLNHLSSHTPHTNWLVTVMCGSVSDLIAFHLQPLFNLGPLLHLGPKFITLRTFITFRTKRYYT